MKRLVQDFTLKDKNFPKQEPFDTFYVVEEKIEAEKEVKPEEKVEKEEAVKPEGEKKEKKEKKKLVLPSKKILKMRELKDQDVLRLPLAFPGPVFQNVLKIELKCVNKSVEEIENKLAELTISHKEKIAENFENKKPKKKTKKQRRKGKRVRN